MEPWFIQFADRFHWEREALEKQGFFLSKEKFEKEDRIEFIGKLNIDNKEYPLRIFYPPGFPFFPPECYCVDKNMFIGNKHILPNNGKMCLYKEWEDNSNLTGIEVLDRAKEWLIKTINDSFLSSEETDGPEPKQYHLLSEKDMGVIITPEEVFLPDWKSKEGNFSISLQRFSTSEGNYFYKGLLLKIHSNQKSYLNEEELNFLKKSGFEYQGKCFEVDAPPPYFENQNELIGWLEKQGHKDIYKKCKEASPHSNGNLIKKSKQIPLIGTLLGLKYKDEVGKKGNIGTRFLVVGLKSSTIVNKQIIHFPFIIFKSEEISQSKLFNRSPNLRPLSKKHILIIGLGTIGSSVAVDLAKAGIGELTLVDMDTVSVGNVIRQETTLNQIGFSKPFAVESIIKVHNPYTNVHSYSERWGQYTDEKIIQSRLNDVDLIVCAVGNEQTELYLNHLVYRFNIPVIYAYTGEGAWSGRVFRVIPGETGCYNCHKYFMGENSNLVLTKPDTSVEIYDAGCATPAFTGSGIDTGIIANLTSRLSIQTVLTDNKDAYEQTENDHFVWFSQGNSGNLKIVQQKIPIHPKCKRCNPNV